MQPHPWDLQAMKEMQASNPHKEVASNAQIMFLVLNASGLCLIPISIMVYRAQLGAADPADIFIPILIATFFANMTGLISVSIVQKINLLDRNNTVLSGGNDCRGSSNNPFHEQHVAGDRFRLFPKLPPM